MFVSKVIASSVGKIALLKRNASSCSKLCGNCRQILSNKEISVSCMLCDVEIGSLEKRMNYKLSMYSPAKIHNLADVIMLDAVGLSVEL